MSTTQVTSLAGALTAAKNLGVNKLFSEKERPEVTTSGDTPGVIPPTHDTSLEQ